METPYSAALLQRPAKSPYAAEHDVTFSAHTFCKLILLPWFIFMLGFSLMCFRMHVNHEGLTWFLVLAIFFIVVILAIKAIQTCAVEATLSSAAVKLHPLMFVTGLGMWIAGLVGGQMVFRDFELYYDMIDLASYDSIDPAHTMGETLMDAGRVFFTRNSTVDVSKIGVFQHGDAHCVAPIISSKATYANYDFWAVGTNCCSIHHKTSHCQDWRNVEVHGGVRVMKENMQEYYRMAVQQAESEYNIQAIHPIFFQWVADPIVEVNDHRERGIKEYLMGSLLALGVLCAIPVIAVICSTMK